jgi:hypothetical protein
LLQYVQQTQSRGEIAVATGEKPDGRFQFTVADLLVISVACVLWVLVFAPMGPAPSLFEDRFIHPSGYKPVNCVFLIVMTVLTGAATLFWARGMDRRRRTRRLVLALLLIVPFFLAVVLLSQRYTQGTRSEQMWLMMRHLGATQEEYKRAHGEYATRLGKTGLDFKVEEVAQAEGLPGEPGAKPFNGCVYRVLKAQGPHAPGGRMSFITTGKDGTERMTGGFAIISFPVRANDPGVAFMVSHHGNVYGKALGSDAARIGSTMVEFDPDGSWVKD